MSLRHRQLKRARYYAKQDIEFTLDNPPCWCGETRPYYEDVFSGCGGTGMLECLCGGDFCVCHNHGEVECFGCPDCDPCCEGEDEDDFDLWEEENRL